MCGLFTKALPVLGAIAGSFIPGVGTAIGAAIGGAVGGAASGYAQTHQLGGTLLGGVTGGAGGYFMGPSIASGLGGLFSSAPSALGELSATSAVNAAPSLGALESGLGGSAMFGANAGTGTALGSAAGALGGQGLGIAGGDALSGIGTGMQFLGGLGGGYGGTGLGQGAQLGASESALNGINGIGTASSTADAGAGQSVAGSTSPVGTMANSPTAATTNVSPIASGETSQAVSPMGNTLGNPTQAAGNTMEGTQAVAPGQNVGAALQGGSQGSNLSTMYGPNSTAMGSPMGQGVSATGAGFNNVQAGALGEAAGGAGKMGEDFASQAMPWMRLGNVGLNAYQQYAQQQAQNAYRDQIANIFSPNGAYAQQMQSNIARQYAAMGKRAEVGPQQVQLAAALAQAQAQAMGGGNYYRAATATPGANMLNSIFANFGSPQGMQALNSLYGSASSGLSSLFGG